MSEKKRVLIMGACGRDFHNFNIYFRNKKEFEVVAFTATQIPEMGNRVYPKELAGENYPEGIPIHDENELPKLLKEKKVEIVVFSYSDVNYKWVMERAEVALANGASFWLLGPKETMLTSNKPVIAICAIRTGAGKSPLTRKICEILKEKGVKFCVVRHPMAYGDLKRQMVQRIEKLEDLDYYNCTIEEREEFEPHIKMGHTVFAGVDYLEILKEAQRDFSLIIWEGGNNDFPFYKPALLFVVCDPLRAGDEVNSHPGFALFQMADVLVITKISQANSTQLKILSENIKKHNPLAQIIKADLVFKEKKLPRGKKVLIVEDGPTTTHGGMAYGAGYIFAKKKGLKVVDPRPGAVGTIKNAYKEYPHLKMVIPAIGYKDNQLQDLRLTLEKIKADFVISATPVDLNRLFSLNKPIIHIEYYFKERGNKLERIIDEFLKKYKL